MNGKDKKAKRWLPIALCCLPGVVVAIVVVGLAAGSIAPGAALDGPLGFALLALALLACPLSMALMMARRGSNQNGVPGRSLPLVACCGPAEEVPVERLAALRERREALERELAEMQTR